MCLMLNQTVSVAWTLANIIINKLFTTSTIVSKCGFVRELLFWVQLVAKHHAFDKYNKFNS